MFVFLGKAKAATPCGLPFGTSLSCFLRSLSVVTAAYFVLQVALLISPALHYRASLRSTSLRFIPATFLSANRSPPAAHVWLATGFGAVMVFVSMALLFDL
jgi:hypothetical protein